MKIQVHNKSSLKERRRQLRKDMTEAESLLWEKLRARRFNDVKFQRQHSIGNYIVDFYCAEHRIIIELDGAPHLEENQKEMDKERDEHLLDMNYTVLRFWNDEVVKDIEKVLKKIEKHL